MADGSARGAGSRLLGVALAAVVFLWCWAFLGQWFYGRHNEVPGQHHDAEIYRDYAAAMSDGRVPYRDFEVVYPPGALPVFAAPTVFPDTGDQAGYDRWFGRLLAGCGVLCLLLMLLARPPTLGIWFFAVSPLLVGSILLSRYDLVPATLVVGALAAFVRDRGLLGWGALGAAFALKLFAIVLLPLAVVWTLRRHGTRELWRGIAAWALVVGAAFVPFLVLAPHGLWDSLHDQATRAIQIESLPGSFLMTFGHPLLTDSLGSVSIDGYGFVGIGSAVVGLAVLVAISFAFARGPLETDRLVRYAAASVCTFVAFGKVLSPQYLIWLVPLVPLVRGVRGALATVLLAATLVGTQWYFPDRYGAVIEYRLAWFVFVRDLTLVGLVAVLAVGMPRARPGRPR